MKKYVFYAVGEEKPKPIKIDMQNHDLSNYDQMLKEADEKIRNANPTLNGTVKIFGFGDA